jgi:UPF0755 protein
MALHGKQVPISSKNTRAARAAHARASEQFKTYDTSAIMPKRSKAPTIVALVIVVIALVAIAIGIYTCTRTTEVELLPSDQEAVITVESGEGAKAIGETLASAGLVSSAQSFVDAVNSQNAASALIPGSYVFKGGTSVDDIVKALTTGPSSTGFTLTVPEGYTREAIASAVQDATEGRITSQQFLDASADASKYAADYSFLESAGTASLEGFLFPKTYTVTAADTATDVVKMMLAQFKSETSGLDWSVPTAKGLSLYDAVKLASIVEKEATNSNYMPDVASVFYNRLASERPYLESDATTAYEVGHDPTAEEVHANTPYSTYTNSGLPPTPICNPSLDALKAVCNPTATDYMYFYTNSDGSMVFSQTYEEHQAAIN